jgi:hypothetical protein
MDEQCIETIVQNVASIDSFNDLFNVVIDIMEYYEKYRFLKGDEKRDKVQKMVLLVLLSVTKDDERQAFYKDIVPMIIELVIEISKRKKLLINVLEKTGCASCFKFSQ